MEPTLVTESRSTWKHYNEDEDTFKETDFYLFISTIFEKVSKSDDMFNEEVDIVIGRILEDRVLVNVVELVHILI